MLWQVAIRPVTLTDPERADLVKRAGCGHAPDLPDWRPGTGMMSAGTAPAADLPDDSDCLIPPDAGYLSQENQLYRVQIVQGGTRAQARFVWSRENGAVQARLARNAAGAFVLQAAREDEALGFPSGTWVEVIDDRDVAQEASEGRFWHDIGRGPWDSSGRPSEVRINRVVRVRPEAVRRVTGKVSQAVFAEVAAAMTQHLR